MQLASVVFTSAVLSTAVPLAGSGAQLTFPKPDDAASALAAAILAEDDCAFRRIVGPELADVWNTGDPQRDAIDRLFRVEQASNIKLVVAAEEPDRILVFWSHPATRFPAPLVRENGRWRFDGIVGAEEVTRQRIQRNEAAAVELLGMYVDAQFEFYQGALTFAEKIRSSRGLHDGLYWADNGEEDESFVGPPFARAAFGEDRLEGAAPQFGYYFKILLRQGPHAPEGAFDYRLGGKMTRGFAMIAWPAAYGDSGVHSFLVNHLGDIFQRDLGSMTGDAAPAIAVFDPDAAWTRLLNEGD